MPKTNEPNLQARLEVSDEHLAAVLQLGMGIVSCVNHQDHIASVVMGRALFYAATESGLAGAEALVENMDLLKAYVTRATTELEEEWKDNVDIGAGNIAERLKEFN